MTPNFFRGAISRNAYLSLSVTNGSLELSSYGGGRGSISSTDSAYVLPNSLPIFDNFISPSFGRIFMYMPLSVSVPDGSVDLVRLSLPTLTRSRFLLEMRGIILTVLYFSAGAEIQEQSFRTAQKAVPVAIVPPPPLRSENITSPPADGPRSESDLRTESIYDKIFIFRGENSK